MGFDIIHGVILSNAIPARGLTLVPDDDSLLKRLDRFVQRLFYALDVFSAKSYAEIFHTSPSISSINLNTEVESRHVRSTVDLSSAFYGHESTTTT